MTVKCATCRTWEATAQMANVGAKAADLHADAAEARAERAERALRAVEDARQYAQRCVGSLPLEMGEYFERRQAEAASMARAVLGERPPTEPAEARCLQCGQAEPHMHVTEGGGLRHWPPTEQIEGEAL